MTLWKSPTGVESAHSCQPSLPTAMYSQIVSRSSVTFGRRFEPPIIHAYSVASLFAAPGLWLPVSGPLQTPMVRTGKLGQQSSLSLCLRALSVGNRLCRF